MKVNKWTVGLAAAGLVSLPWIAQAEEKAVNTVMTAVASTTISGYVDTSAHWNMGTGNANPAPYLYNQGKADGFNLNRVNISLEKALSEERWGAGYRADVWLGPDANVFNTVSSGTSISDLAIKQAYVLFRAPLHNGLDFKMGVFNSIIGYESHDSLYNGNYTRSYAVSLEPHTHTGLLATFHALDWLDLSAGIANTMGPTINAKTWQADDPKAESHKTYMGAIEIKAPNTWGFLEGSKITAGAVTGFGSQEDNQDNWYLGAKLNTPLHGLSVGASFDYVKNLQSTGSQSLSASAAGIGSTTLGSISTTRLWNSARAIGVYTSYQMEKWGIHLRGEYADAFQNLDSSSSSVNSIGGFNVQTTATTSTPIRADVFALTTTLSYELWKNVLTRLEFRWDHSAKGMNEGRLFGGDDGNPTRKNEYLLAANVIYKF